MTSILFFMLVLFFSKNQGKCLKAFGSLDSFSLVIWKEKICWENIIVYFYNLKKNYLYELAGLAIG